MIEVNQADFERIVGEAIDTLPEKYAKRMQNVAFVVEDLPTEEQRQKLHLHNGHILFGLYEGIPMTRRGTNYTYVLPDKITIFKQPLELISHSLADLKEHVRYTVWHEVAHHFGLDHGQIGNLDGSH